MKLKVLQHNVVDSAARLSVLSLAFRLNGKPEKLTRNA